MIKKDAYALKYMLLLLISCIFFAGFSLQQVNSAQVNEVKQYCEGYNQGTWSESSKECIGSVLSQSECEALFTGIKEETGKFYECANSCRNGQSGCNPSCEKVCSVNHLSPNSYFTKNSETGAPYAYTQPTQQEIDDMGKETCEVHSGQWIENKQECENANVGKKECESVGGSFYNCANSCRNLDSESKQNCTPYCVKVCKIGEKLTKPDYFDKTDPDYPGGSDDNSTGNPFNPDDFVTEPKLTAGSLRHSVFSPFKTIIVQQLANYDSSLRQEQTVTTIVDKFMDFDEYAEDETKEPYCRIGGQYYVKVENNAEPASGPVPGAEYYSEIFKMYYCKTTQNLLESTKIPSSWQEDDIIVYCNDGSMINVPDVNFDMYSVFINTYKACVVRNMNKSEVIITGFEIGNRVVDNSRRYFFDKESMKGPQLGTLEYSEDSSSEIEFSFNQFNKTSGEEFLTCSKHTLTTSDGKNLTFIHNNITKTYLFYSGESDISADLMDVNDVFGKDIGISRVAFFKKAGEKKIYGYEKFEKSTLKPVYIIELDNFEGYNQDVCNTLLGTHKTSLILEDKTQIICDADKIKIVAVNMNKDKVTKAFNMFKNIMMTLK